MAFTKIDHVGILVDDLEVGRHVFSEGWGLSVDEHRSPWPQGRPGTFDGVTSIEIPIGEMYLEFSKPNDSSSRAAQFVAERRAGMYYVSIASDDIANDVKMLTSKGVKIEGEWSGKGPVFPASPWASTCRSRPKRTITSIPSTGATGPTGMAHIGLAARNPVETRNLGNIFGCMRTSRWSEGKSRRAPAAGSNGTFTCLIPDRRLGHRDYTSDNGRQRHSAVMAQRDFGRYVSSHCPWTPDVKKAVEKGKAVGLQQIGNLPPTSGSVGWFHPRTCMALIEI
jgi:hypothetical protein